MSVGREDRLRRRRGPALDVAVVGGGMVGAATALALAREGFATALLEVREPRPWRVEDEIDPRVVGLAPSSIRLLDQLGVWAGVRAARTGPYERMHVWDAENGAAIDFTAADEGWDLLGHIVENDLVQWHLWQALEAAGVRRLCPAEVVDFHAGEERIELALAHGEQLPARLLIAADGAGSPLRSRAGIASDTRDYGQLAVVAHVRTELPHQRTAWQRFQPGGPLALLPLGDGRSSIVWSLPRDEAERVLALDESAFCAALGIASDFRLGRITASTPRLSFPLRLQLASSYQAPRMVLLGDAAHSVHPLAGQGVNLGLRDVGELRNVLREAARSGRDIGAAHVLRRYARRRISADTLDGRGFDALARIYDWRAAPLVAARGAGVRLIDRCHPLKRALAAHAAGD